MRESRAAVRRPSRSTDGSNVGDPSWVSVLSLDSTLISTSVFSPDKNEATAVRTIKILCYTTTLSLRYLVNQCHSTHCSRFLWSTSIPMLCSSHPRS